MTRLAWYKRYPVDFRDGTRKLTFEERGFYGDVLDLIYESGNALVDDDAANAHQLHADLRTFRRLKARLVAHGKLYVADGMLRNGRADAEATAAANRIALARDHAKLGGEKSRKSGTKSSNYNGSGGAGAQAGATAGALTGFRKKEEGKKETLPAAAGEPPTRAHTREEAAAATGPSAKSIPLEADFLGRVEACGHDPHAAAKVLAAWKAEFREGYAATLEAVLARAKANPLALAELKFGDLRRNRQRAEEEARRQHDGGWSVEGIVTQAIDRETAARDAWTVTACPQIGTDR